jgi:hypothetical protein
MKLKKTINYTKRYKLKKITIKIMMVKIKIKNKLEGNQNFSLEG